MSSMHPGQTDPHLGTSDKAAICGEPSYVWRDGQQRRLEMILSAAGKRVSGVVLENGCGVGQYLDHLAGFASQMVGLEIEFDRAFQAAIIASGHPHAAILCAAGEQLPFSTGFFDLILSHEVLEHVTDDVRAVQEMVRTLKPGGRIVLFVPNRGYPFETHGFFWRGRYRFGNIPLINYLPPRVRDRLAPHVRVYSQTDLAALFDGQPVQVVHKTIIFGAYDNIIARSPALGKTLRSILQRLEKTPLKWFGLSHFWVIEKNRGNQGTINEAVPENQKSHLE